MKFIILMDSGSSFQIDAIDGDAFRKVMDKCMRAKEVISLDAMNTVIDCSKVEAIYGVGE